MAHFFEVIYSRNSQLAESYRNYKICEKYAKMSESIVKIVHMAYGMCDTLFTLFSILISFVSGEKMLAVPMSLPCIDIQTTDGFTALFLLQTVLLVIVVCINSSFDSLLIVNIANMRMLSEIMIGQIAELEQMIILNCARLDIKRWLLNIVSMHRKYND